MRTACNVSVLPWNDCRASNSTPDEGDNGLWLYRMSHDQDASHEPHMTHVRVWGWAEGLRRLSADHRGVARASAARCDVDASYWLVLDHGDS